MKYQHVTPASHSSPSIKSIFLIASSILSKTSVNSTTSPFLRVLESGEMGIPLIRINLYSLDPPDFTMKNAPRSPGGWTRIALSPVAANLKLTIVSLFVTVILVIASSSLLSESLLIVYSRVASVAVGAGRGVAGIVKAAGIAVGAGGSVVAVTIGRGVAASAVDVGRIAPGVGVPRPSNAVESAVRSFPCSAIPNAIAKPRNKNKHVTSTPVVKTGRKAGARDAFGDAPCNTSADARPCVWNPRGSPQRPQKRAPARFECAHRGQINGIMPRPACVGTCRKTWLQREPSSRSLGSAAAFDNVDRIARRRARAEHSEGTWRLAPRQVAWREVGRAMAFEPRMHSLRAMPDERRKVRRPWSIASTRSKRRQSNSSEHG